MLKPSTMLKTTPEAGVDALLDIVKNIPFVEIKSVTASKERGPDFLLTLLIDGHPHQLVCEVKENGQPRYARMALLELRNYVVPESDATPVFIAPYVSPAVRQLCEQMDVSYVDLEGNARISFDKVFIERIVPKKPVEHVRELRSIFKPKSAQVLRAMLREPGRTWKVSDLSKASNVSLGHVSNVKKALIDREWAVQNHGGLALSAPDALLEAWRESYSLEGETLRLYTTLHGSKLEDAARSVLSETTRGHAAFSSFSAAAWLAPFARTGKHYFYADRQGAQMLSDALFLNPSSRGGENVIIVIPKDEGVLMDTVEPAAGAICTSPVQTYLDLCKSGERGIEAADHLRKECLTWSK